MSENTSEKFSMLGARNLIFSIFGLIGIVSLTGLFMLSFIINQFSSSGPSVGHETYNLVWFLAFFALLMLPFLLIAIYQLSHKAPPTWLKIPSLSMRHYGLILLIWLIILLGSYFLGQGEDSYWLLSPPLKIFSIFIPLALLIVYLAQKFQLKGSSRNWGLISFSMIITEPLTIVFEIILVMVFLLAVGVSGDWSQALGNDAFVYMNRLMYGYNNPDILSRIVTPFLSQPLILFIIFTLFLVIVPMLEEIMKPLAIWLLDKRTLSAKDGFYYGALTGMVFALIESILGLTNFAMDSWVSISIVRLGTGFLHIFTAALMGWALTSSWQKNKFGKLITTYLLCIGIHGVWNFLAISTSINEIITFATPAMQSMVRVGFPILLVLMAIGMLTGLILLGNKLTRVDGQSKIAAPADQQTV